MATIRLILLTHGHFDHAGAAEELAEEYEIPVIAHEAEKETLEDPRRNQSGGMMGQPTAYSADTYVRDGQQMTLAGMTFTVLHTPGHTPGGCCFYFPREGLLIAGDTLFAGSVGRTDFPGGSMAQLVAGIREKLLTLPDETQVLCGHGESTSIGDERRWNPYCAM